TTRTVAAARWVPPASQAGHGCLIAETYHPTEDPMTRPANDFQVLADRKVAQRNVIVSKPSSPFFVAPFEVRNPTRRPVVAVIDVTLATPEGFREDGLLQALPPTVLEVRRYGLLEYKLGQEIGP